TRLRPLRSGSSDGPARPAASLANDAARSPHAGSPVTPPAPRPGATTLRSSPPARSATIARPPARLGAFQTTLRSPPPATVHGRRRAFPGPSLGGRWRDCEPESGAARLPFLDRSCRETVPRPCGLAARFAAQYPKDPTSLVGANQSGSRLAAAG